MFRITASSPRIVGASNFVSGAWARDTTTELSFPPEGPAT